MTQYRLKINVAEFEMVDGPLKGRSYKHGIVYDEIPPEESRKFDEIKETMPTAGDRPVKADKQKAAATASSETGEVK